MFVSQLANQMTRLGHSRRAGNLIPAKSETYLQVHEAQIPFVCYGNVQRCSLKTKTQMFIYRFLVKGVVCNIILVCAFAGMLYIYP